MKRPPSPAPEPAPPRPPRRSFLHWSTVAALLIALPLAYLAYTRYLAWDKTNRRLAAVQGEVGTLKVKNAGLARAYDVLQNRTFQVCNRTADELEVLWLAAAYESRGQLSVFDASRCEGWQPQLVPGGGSPKTFTFSSAQEGCNWDGSVIFYAMRAVRTSEDGASFDYTVAGPWMGFERDCFNVQ